MSERHSIVNGDLPLDIRNAALTYSGMTSLLLELRNARGWSQQKLADEVSRTGKPCGQPDIARLEIGKKKMTMDWMVRLGRALDVDPKAFLDAPGKDTPVLRLPGGDVAIGPRHLPVNPRDGRDMIPVRSAARGGEQEMFLHDGPIDWVPRPYSLLNVREPYALYMVGESMLPRFRPGQRLYVNPHRPATVGYGVVVTKTNHAVMVKEFVRRTNRELILRQYNPDEPVEIDLADVIELHTIVQIDEP